MIINLFKKGKKQKRQNASEVLYSLVSNVYSAGESCLNCKNLDDCHVNAGNQLIALYRDHSCKIPQIIRIAKDARSICSEYEFQPRGE